MKTLHQTMRLQVRVDYPEGHASEAISDLEDLTERIVFWIRQEVASSNNANQIRPYHKDIKLSCIASNESNEIQL